MMEPRLWLLTWLVAATAEGNVSNTVQKSVGVSISSGPDRNDSLADTNASLVIDNVLTRVVHSSMRDMVEKLSSSLKDILRMYLEKGEAATGASEADEDWRRQASNTVKPDGVSPISIGDQNGSVPIGDRQSIKRDQPTGRLLDSTDRSFVSRNLRNKSKEDLEGWIQQALINMMWKGVPGGLAGGRLPDEDPAYASTAAATEMHSTETSTLGRQETPAAESPLDEQGGMALAGEEHDRVDTQASHSTTVSASPSAVSRVESADVLADPGNYANSTGDSAAPDLEIMHELINSTNTEAPDYAESSDSSATGSGIVACVNQANCTETGEPDAGMGEVLLVTGVPEGLPAGAPDHGPAVKRFFVPDAGPGGPSDEHAADRPPASPLLVQTVLVSAAATLAIVVFAVCGVFLAVYGRKRSGARQRWAEGSASFKALSSRCVLKEHRGSAAEAVGRVPPLSPRPSIAHLSPFYYDTSRSDWSLLSAVKDRSLDACFTSPAIFTTGGHVPPSGRCVKKL